MLLLRLTAIANWLGCQTVRRRCLPLIPLTPCYFSSNFANRNAWASEYCSDLE